MDAILYKKEVIQGLKTKAVAYCAHTLYNKYRYNYCCNTATKEKKYKTDQQ